MKFFALLLAFLMTNPLLGQDDQIDAIVSKGIELHDLGKYEEAINQYKAALEIDKKSCYANYEIAYSYFMIKQYDEAIKHGKIVLKQEKGHMQEAYMVVGNALDMTGKPKDAIKTYEEGLEKYPNSNLLNYNLALTLHNQKDYKKAEKFAIAAIMAKPQHASAHVLLSSIMQQSGQRIKSILPLYYFLLLEPNSKRSLPNYNWLQKQLGQGVEKEDDKKINITIPLSSSKEADDFAAAEMMLGLLAASKYTEENKNKSELELFIGTNDGIFSMLGEMKDDKKGFWWDMYVTKFYDLVKSEHVAAYSYYISQSTNAEEVNKWIDSNAGKMQALLDWIEK